MEVVSAAVLVRCRRVTVDSEGLEDNSLIGALKCLAQG